MLGVRRGIFFQDLADGGEARPAFERHTELGVLLQRADGKNLHAAVPAVSDIAGNAQFFRGVLGKIAEADALDPAGDEVAFRLFRFAHKPGKL